MIKRFFATTPRVGLAIAGFACALLVLEIQRMPAVHPVTFSMFAPMPYFIEVAVILVLAVLYGKKRTLRLSSSRIVRTVVALGALVCTLLVVSNGALPGEAAVLVAQSLYRICSACLLIFWGERFVELGARRAAFVFAFACLSSGAITLVLSVLDKSLSYLAVCALPIVAGACFVLYEPKTTQSDDEAHRSVDSELSQYLPRFSSESKKQVFVAFGLIALPLLCRGPFVSIQSAWMPFQGDYLVSFLIQLSIGCGVIVAGIVALLVVLRVWNRNFVLVFELFVLPITFLAFYASQASADLWFIYLLIVDATYKVTLFYLFATPFLFSETRNPLLPLLLSFALMIFSRAAFSALYAVLPPAVFAAIASVIVLVTFIGGGVLAFLVIQKNTATSRFDSDGAKADREDVSDSCAVLAKRFGLTAREEEILGLLAQKYHAPYIAKKLVVSQSTVKTHMRNLYAKLDVHSQAELYLLLDRVGGEVEVLDAGKPAS
ncbi:helix-turn-helix transcriptional regulator [Raoultibacter phocaeensis]|uniref:helix-turn-helix transcriptional regulator n=1 Tax=Raoultibacter phocaeensis TaxID=2479841 RepID=UPI00111A683D|nr:helix-turn-helix transcriptional regulator [Raoultibacter phocaeensis]